MHILKLTDTVERRLLRTRGGRDVDAERIAAKIIADVRRRGDAALFAWALRLDGVDLKRQGIWISRRELREAHQHVDLAFMRALKHAAANVRKVAQKQLPRKWTLEVERGVNIGQIVRPIDAVGCYIPGGRFALVSTLVMTVVPALVAGVKRIIVVCPRPNKELLAAATFLGVSEIARIGGAQAIAALAYGTSSVPRVDKILGPGNRFVTAAKQLISSDCPIDVPAGPTEALVFAARGNARWIAADLLAQAEHAPDAVTYLLTPSTVLARQVQSEVIAQLKTLPKDNPAHSATKQKGAILLAPSLQAAYKFVNNFAAEHLSLPEHGSAVLKAINAAGTVFLGAWSAQPLGDYASGSNHVLPTSGWARLRGGLSAADFVKCISVQTISRTGFRRLAEDAQSLARAEGLMAHARAVEVRR